MQAQAELRKLYRRYRYHPILALRSALPLFFQLPFLFAAYHALNGLEELSGVSFWIINDLSKRMRWFWVQFLPFMMTG
jgi:membrane protein insertase Oxa1/YidC/SpoIIIJ